MSILGIFDFIAGPRWDTDQAQQPAPVAPQPMQRAEMPVRQEAPLARPSMPKPKPEHIMLALLPDNSYRTTCSINGVEFEAVVDTGATACTIPEDLAKRIGIRPSDLPQSGTVTDAHGGTSTTKAGPMTWTIGGKLVAIDAMTHVKLGYKYRVPGTSKGIDVLLGMTALDQFNIKLGSGKMMIAKKG